MQQQRAEVPASSSRQQPQTTQQQNQPSHSYNSPDPSIQNPLQEELDLVMPTFDSQIFKTLRQMMRYREDRTFHVFGEDKTDYFQCMWKQLKNNLALESEQLQGDLLEEISIRQTNILYDILENRLDIAEHSKLKPYDYQEDQKNKKVALLKEHELDIHRKLNDITQDIGQMHGAHRQTPHQSRTRGIQLTQAKKKEFEQYVKKQKKQKEERSKLIEQQRKKDEQAKIKREQEEKESKEKQLQERHQELLKQIQQKQQDRRKAKSQREQLSKQYKMISKSMAEQPPLFKKIEQQYKSRYSQLQTERKQKVLSERHSMLVPLDPKSLQQHEKRYEEQRLERQKQRKERGQELEKMLQMQQEEMHQKYKSHYDFKKESKYNDQKEEERKLALQKREKVKKYIEETVKERYLPRVDEDKRRELIQLMEDMQKKKVKKVIREDGRVEYEQLKPSDPRMMGLQYLQKTKQMAAKARSRRKSSDNVPPDTAAEHPKVFDYLSERRKKGTSMSNRQRYSFVNRNGMSFDDKVKKVQLQSQKLEELARQKQMKLKYGKFTTSEEILQHKEEIDQHYMDIINMKLKLINQKEE